jgi:hypothetical protein
MGDLVQLPGSPSRKSSGSGGSGPEDPLLERRVERLETDVRDIRDRVGKIEERLARIEGGFVGINAKLDALPTVWTFSAALIGVVIAMGGLTLAIVRVAMP